MVLQTILEGLELGALLALVCAVGICKGAVRLLEQIDYDFSEAEKNFHSLMQRFGCS